MGLRVRPCAPCEFLLKCSNPVEWVIATYFIVIIAYLIFNLVVNLIVQNNHPSHCEESILTFSWISLLSILFLIAQCVFAIKAVDTKGRFNDCEGRSENECCCCCLVPCSLRGCAVFTWLIVFVGSLTLALYGSIELGQQMSCLPIHLVILTIVSLVIQYLSSATALVGFLFRAGILVWEDHPVDQVIA